MPNKDFHNDYSVLISRYLSNNASPAEINDLETWVLANPKHKKQFIAYKKAWMLSGIEQNNQSLDIENLWKQTADQLAPKGRVVEMKPKQNRYRWLSIAAAIALLAAVSIWAFQNLGSEAPMIVKSTDEVKNFELSDGSQITLNQSASLVYTPIGADGKRRVELQGDAFFEVARNEAHPFIISTPKVEIQVLGTSFYVDSREGQSEVQVIVQSGSVAVRANSKEIILAPNEKAIFKKNSGELLKVQNEDANFLSLKTNTLNFNKTRLEEVAIALNRHFNVDISFANPILKDCELSATYSNKSLSFVLNLIEQTLGIQVEQTGNKIVLSGTECK